MMSPLIARIIRVNASAKPMAKNDLDGLNPIDVKKPFYR
jgi:hypothetical protein